VCVCAGWIILANTNAKMVLDGSLDVQLQCTLMYTIIFLMYSTGVPSSLFEEFFARLKSRKKKIL